MVISRLEELPPNDDNDPPRHHPEHRLLSVLAHGAKAQAYLYMAKVVLAEKSINDASKELTDVDLLGVQGWIHNLKAQIALAIGNIGGAQTSYKAAMAAANSSQRPDLMLSIEISEIEFKMRCAMGNREKILFMLSELSHREARARALGSQKTVVGILLIRARALLYLEQTEGARSAIIEATCLSILNGMRLRRISSLILMAALMGLRGQKDSAIALLASLRTLATQIRYIRAVIDIDKLEHAIVTRGDIRPWAGHLSDSELNEHFR